MPTKKDVSKTKNKIEVEEPIDNLLEPPDESINRTTSNAIVIRNFSEIVSSVMNEAQFTILSGRTPKEMIKRRPGKGGKTFSYVPHGYVTAQLNRAFGFDWSFDIMPNGNGDFFQILESAVTESNGKKVTTPKSVIVLGKLTVNIHDPRDLSKIIATINKTSTGEKEFVPGMTWGGLIKSAESDALKKAASRLGIALDLYWQDTDEDYGNGTTAQPESLPLAPDLIEKAKSMIASGRSAKDTAKELDLTVQDLVRAGVEI